MSAGTGILHSEKNDSWTLTGESEHKTPVHFVQMWVLPDERNLAAGYEQLDINEELTSGGLVTVASGMAKHAQDRAIQIKQRHAALHAARLGAGQHVQLPAAPFIHLFVARGQVTLEGAGRLEEGDAVRISASEGQRVTASGDAELLVWEMSAAAG
jgi:redox-sensitive bicupin YhaK (pirin superfamily)